MQIIRIQAIPGFEEWRAHARQCLTQKIPPHAILWQDYDAAPTLDLGLPPPRPMTNSLPDGPIAVPRDFLEQASIVACHQNPEKFALLYRVLWRLVYENKNLLHYQTDADILKLRQMAKAVNRDAYKIKAFLRFRECRQGDEAHFISWYEPEHFTLELVLPFFQTRFRNMRWSILTPYRGATWDGQQMAHFDNPDPALHHAHDNVEAYWLNYYAHTFNPARLKKKAMLAQMPKKYWKNMPETALIPDLIQGAESRVQSMIEQDRPS